MKAFFGSKPVETPADPRSLAERILDALFYKRVIVNCARNPYLHRWYVIRSERFGLFIHKFVRSDEDRAVHDHPWDFIVIPIWRGYVEHSVKFCDCMFCDLERYSRREGKTSHDKPIKKRVLPILGTRYRRATYRHRVELMPCDDKGQVILEDDCPKCEGRGELPSWSLFIRLKKRRDWGFWMPEGFVQWAKFWQDKCE